MAFDSWRWSLQPFGFAVLPEEAAELESWNGMGPNLDRQLLQSGPLLPFPSVEPVQ